MAIYTSPFSIHQPINDMILFTLDQGENWYLVFMFTLRLQLTWASFLMLSGHLYLSINMLLTTFLLNVQTFFIDYFVFIFYLFIILCNLKIIVWSNLFLVLEKFILFQDYTDISLCFCLIILNISLIFKSLVLLGFVLVYDMN